MRESSTQIEVLDIGGGLPVSYEQNDEQPTFQNYTHVLRTAVPGIFEQPARPRRDWLRGSSAALRLLREAETEQDVLRFWT